MLKLTKRQQQVLDVIQHHIDNSGLPPTRAEIASELGFKSVNAAEEHLKALKKKGAIETIPGASRGIRICNPPANESELPIIGKVAAGAPILAIEHVESNCPVHPDFFQPRADFLLQVQGDSMIDVGIFDGDLLAVHKTEQVNNGDIVVARVDDEVTVKRIEVCTDSKQVLLHAENTEYQPIVVDPNNQEFIIEGLSVGVIRKQH